MERTKEIELRLERATPAPWTFDRMKEFDALHKLRGTAPEPHEGYFRTNGGDWAVGCEDGRVCLADFKGTAKRGQGYTTPDPEGMANASLIAAAPDDLRYLLDRVKSLEGLLRRARFAVTTQQTGGKLDWLEEVNALLAPSATERSK